MSSSASIASLQNLIADRLEAFNARIGEVPASAFDDMSCAVGELTSVVGTVTRVEARLKKQSPSDRLLFAAAALRNSRPDGTREVWNVLEAVEASINEMFSGLESFGTGERHQS